MVSAVCAPDGEVMSAVINQCTCNIAAINQDIMYVIQNSSD
jgi:hypothetical protein